MPEENPNPFVIPPPEPSVEDTQPMEPPVPVAPDSPEETAPPPGEETKPEKVKEQCLKDIQKILVKYGGEESNIPRDHEYWGLINQYRGL